MERTRETIACGGNGFYRDSLLLYLSSRAPSFSVDGKVIQWENWKVHVGFNTREGLALSDISFRGGDEDRFVSAHATFATKHLWATQFAES